MCNNFLPGAGPRGAGPTRGTLSPTPEGIC